MNNVLKMPNCYVKSRQDINTNCAQEEAVAIIHYNGKNVQKSVTAVS